MTSLSKTPSNTSYFNSLASQSETQQYPPNNSKGDPRWQRVPLLSPKFSLSQLLVHPAGVNYLKAFLTKEFSTENLLFWLAVQAYQQCAPNERVERAHQIWDQFLGPKATLEVSLSAQVYKEVKQHFDSNTFDITTFESAQDQAFQDIEKDSLFRFRNSIESEQLQEKLLLEIGDDVASKGATTINLTNGHISFGATTGHSGSISNRRSLFSRLTAFSGVN